MSDAEARSWFEKWRPGDTDTYEEVFGCARGPWTAGGTVRLVEQATSRMNSMKWDKDRAEERANKAEAEIAALKAKLEALTKPAED